MSFKAKLPGAQVELPIKDSDKSKKINPKDLVRTDASEQKLDKFFGTTPDKNQSLSASFVSKVTK